MPDAVDLPTVAMWASIIGTPLTLIGLLIAIITSSKSKSASEQAKSAVTKVRRDILTFDIISDLSKAISGLQEIKRSIRGSELTPAIPDRLSDLRQSLIAIRETVTGLSDDEQVIFQGSILELKMMESNIDSYLQNDDTTADKATMLSSLSDKTDDLQVVLIGLKNRIGRDE